MKTLRAWCELIRLPNTFTALADILAGYWLVTMGLQGSWRLGALLAASACLYSAGMVMNDLHDIETDRRERPDRPLPSGRIMRRHAVIAAVTLMLIGLGSAAVAGNPGDSLRSMIGLGDLSALIALGLMVAILAYDLALKTTPVGPLLMGLCRALNITLPMTIVPTVSTNPQALAPVVLCVYIFAVTTFGRHEASRSSRRRLLVGTGGIGAAMVMLGVFVVWNASNDRTTLILWLATGFHFFRTALRTVRDPSPRRVQYAMKTYILGLIAIDAVFANAAAGWGAGAIVLALLVPALILGRWLYST